MSLTAQHKQQWNQILDLTQQMHDLAVEHEWQKVVEMESARGVQLAAFFENKVSVEDTAEIAKGIQQILESDRKLTESSQQAQHEVVGSMSGIASGRKAVAAYDKCR